MKLERVTLDRERQELAANTARIETSLQRYFRQRDVERLEQRGKLFAAGAVSVLIAIALLMPSVLPLTHPPVLDAILFGGLSILVFTVRTLTS